MVGSSTLDLLHIRVSPVSRDLQDIGFGCRLAVASCQVLSSNWSSVFSSMWLSIVTLGSIFVIPNRFLLKSWVLVSSDLFNGNAFDASKVSRQIFKWLIAPFIHWIAVCRSMVYVLAYFNSLTLKYKLASTDSLYVCGYLSRSLTSLTFTGSTNGGSAPDQYVKSMVKDRRIWLFNAYVPTSYQKLTPYWWSSIAAVLPSVLSQKLITCIRIEVETHDEIHTEKPYTASTR